jgi:hypothetical protein
MTSLGGRRSVWPQALVMGVTPSAVGASFSVSAEGSTTVYPHGTILCADVPGMANKWEIRGITIALLAAVVGMVALGIAGLL